MQTGKVPGNILYRSVTNLIGRGPVAARDCADLGKSDGRVIASTQTGTMGNDISLRMAVYKAANNIWSAGGRLVGIQAAFLLREDAEEQELKAMTRNILRACGNCHTVLTGGHTEVCEGLSHNMVTITAIGEADEYAYPPKTAPGDAIVAVGTVGIEETAYILDDEQMYGKLLTRFSARYLEPVKECEAWIPIEDEAAVAGKFGVKVMHDASDGGIFGALWDMALGTHRGFRVDLKAIPFRQEIVEISTYLGLNPYRMKSSGFFIAVTPDGAGLVEAMRREGMPACIIGYTTDNNDKILCNDEEISYLERK